MRAKFVILGVLATGLVATAALGLVSRDPACCDSRAKHVSYEWSAYNRGPRRGHRRPRRRRSGPSVA